MLPLLHVSPSLSVSVLTSFIKFPILGPHSTTPLLELRPFFFLDRRLYVLICSGLHWIFVATYGLSLTSGSVGYSLLGHSGFSLQWLLVLVSTGSRACPIILLMYLVNLLHELMSPKQN